MRSPAIWTLSILAGLVVGGAAGWKDVFSLTPAVSSAPASTPVASVPSEEVRISLPPSWNPSPDSLTALAERMEKYSASLSENLDRMKNPKVAEGLSGAVVYKLQIDAIQAWAAKDPVKTMEVLGSSGRGKLELYYLYGEALAVWAESDPQAAYQWSKSHDQDGYGLLGEVIGPYWKRDQDAAFGLIRDLSHEKVFSSQERVIVSLLSYQDELPAKDLHRLLGLFDDMYDSSRSGSRAYQEILIKLAKVEPAFVEKLLSKEFDFDDYAEVRCELALTHTKGDRAQALKWLKDHDGSPKELDTFYIRWCLEDPVSSHAAWEAASGKEKAWMTETQQRVKQTVRRHAGRW